MTAIQLTSGAFADHDEIPRHHTGEGDDVSPALAWSSVPDGTLWAVSESLPLHGRPTVDAVHRAVKGRELAGGALMGTYQR